METEAKEIVQKLTEKHQTIASMESCTGGGFANAITNIEGASEVLHFSAVTYCNEYKIKMGVPKEVIETHTVYSLETAKAMSEAIANFSEADYGIGITGKINRSDKNNEAGKDNMVYVSIFEKAKQHFLTSSMEVKIGSRKENKDFIILNTELTEKLLLEGVAREFVSKIQNMRKEKNLEVTDHIHITYDGDHFVKRAIETYQEFIQNETLAESVTFENSGEIVDLNGHETKITIAKV